MTGTGGMDTRLPPSHPVNLRKQVNLTLDPNFSVKSYIGAASTLLEKAQMADAQGHLEMAFVHYLTTASVASFVPKHAEWASVKQSRGATFLAYQELMNRTPDIVKRANAIEQELKARAEHVDMSDGDADDLSHSVRSMDLRASPPRPHTHTRASLPPSPPASLRPHIPPPPTRPARPAPRMMPPSSSMAMAKSASASSAFMSSSPRKPTIPIGQCLSVEELWTYMYPGFDKSLDEFGHEFLVKRPGLTLLLVDIRPRSVHDAGYIRGADTICIEPSALRAPPVSVADIHRHLPPNEAAHMARRTEYDAIVLYDAHTRSFGAAGTATPEQEHIETVVRALEEDVAHSPCLLRGGFSSWSRQVGECGVVSVPTARPSGRAPLPSPGASPRARPATLAPPAPPAPPSMPPRTYQAPAMANASSPPSMSIPSAKFEYPDVPALVSSHTPVPAPPAPAMPPPRTSMPPSLMAGAGLHDLAPPPSFPVARDIRVGLTGLRNFGQTCYMNATIQCLSATILLAQYMLEGAYKKDINTQNPLGTCGTLANAFAALLRALWSEQSVTVAPTAFRDAIGQFAPAFRGSEQQDSQEFLLFLLDGLHEDLNRIVHRPPALELGDAQQAELNRMPQQLASVAEWSMYRRRNDSVVVDTFQGQLRNQLTCSMCGHTSTTYNAFMSLSLPVPTGRGLTRVSLHQCMDAFVREEVLDKGNAWHCPKCKKPRRSTKRLSLARLPPILLIHLKRFTFRGPASNKIETPVLCQTEALDLSNYMPPPLPPGTSVHGIPTSESQRPPYLYDLYAVTHHFGTLNSGHYTASVRTQGQWFYCDDSRVTPSDAQLHTSSPYVLFFARRPP